MQKLCIQWLDLDVRDALGLQSTCKAFKKYVWQTLSQFDSSSFKEHANVQTLLDRVGPSSLLSLNLARYTPIGSQELLSLRHKFPNLLYCAINFAAIGSTTDNIKAILDDYGSLIELAFYNEAPDVDLIKQYNKNLRVCIYLAQIGNYKDAYDPHVYNFCSTADFGTYNVQVPIQIQQNATCGATLGDFTLIGTESGTLYIYKLERNRMRLERVVTNVHTERINSITLANSCLLAASSDGLVTSWMIEEDFVGYNEIPGLELQSQMQFDEPIYYTFYQDDLEQYLAASKRTVYIFKGMLINSISSPEDITGVYLTQEGRYYLSTASRLLFVNELSENNELFQYEIPAPNMSWSPDDTLVAMVTKEGTKLYDAASYSLVTTWEGQFDERPGMLKYNPVKFAVTHASGQVIQTWSLESKTLVGLFSPRMSKKDIIARKPLNCKSMWYDENGGMAFALYSDNKLHWWLEH